MATFKQPCIHCGEMVERDSHNCPHCGSRSPFNYHCPDCLREIQRSDVVCPSCGRTLATVCPYCGGPTFVGNERCDSCGRVLMIRCDNSRCNELMYFEVIKCTACGKKIKSAAKQIQKGA